jgi:hypothetical protein
MDSGPSALRRQSLDDVVEVIVVGEVVVVVGLEVVVRVGVVES